VLPPRLWRWATDPRARTVFAWLVVALVVVHHLKDARTWLANELDTPEHLRRPNSGGHGHTQIDFGGQWLMGRMLVTGHGRELYHRQAQWEVVRAGYPLGDETPVQRDESILPRHERRLGRDQDELGHDADLMMSWFMGKDPREWKTVGSAASTPLVVEFGGNPLAAAARVQAANQAVTAETVAAIEKPALGGPLYPPIHAFFYFPIGLFEKPQEAYYLFHWIAIGFGILAGRGITALTGGRIWWPVASAAVLLYPGCRIAIDLSQNPTISLAIVIWGWVLVTRGREAAGGMIWGLFAFKPVWALAFFLVPVLTGRWRMALAMVGTGAVLGALTLPVVGLQAWFDWLQVGSMGADHYNRSLNWINLSRDLQSIPRRFLHDFTKPEAERETPLANALAWALWGAVFATTVLIYRLRADRTKTVGLGVAFLFLGAWLTCYRFMYYDALLSLMGVVCLAAEPWRLLRTRTFVFTGPDEAPVHGPRSSGFVNSFPLTIILGLYILDNWLTGVALEATFGALGWGSVSTNAAGATVMSTPRIHADTSINYPWDTALVILLWLWCGWRLLRGDERQYRSHSVSSVPMSKTFS
jgi:hypothetical protein